MTDRRPTIKCKECLKLGDSGSLDWSVGISLQPLSLALCFHYCKLIYLVLLYSFWLTQLIFVSSPPVFRHITLDCGSKGRPRPRKNVGWNSRNPSRSSWTSLAMSHCSSLESCSMFPMFPGWSKKPPGKESPNGNCETVTQVTEKATWSECRCALALYRELQ